MIFVYLVNPAWGFNPAHFCDPNMVDLLLPMSVHKELNSLWLTLIAFFDPKHCFVKKSVRKSIYFLTSNRQYSGSIQTVLRLYSESIQTVARQ